MRYLLVVLALVLFTTEIMAQTAAPASPALSGRVLRRQDRQECITQQVNKTLQNETELNLSENAWPTGRAREGGNKKVNSDRQTAMSLWVKSRHVQCERACPLWPIAGISNRKTASRRSLRHSTRHR